MIKISYITCLHADLFINLHRAGERKIQHLFSMSKPSFSLHSFSPPPYTQNSASPRGIQTLHCYQQCSILPPNACRWENVLRQRYVLSLTEIFLLSSRRSSTAVLQMSIWGTYVSSPASGIGIIEYFGSILWIALQLVLFIPHMSGTYLMTYTWIFLILLTQSLSGYQQNIHTLKGTPKAHESKTRVSQNTWKYINLSALICIEVHEATCSKPGTDASLEAIKPKIKYRKNLPFSDGT